MSRGKGSKKPRTRGVAGEKLVQTETVHLFERLKSGRINLRSLPRILQDRNLPRGVREMVLKNVSHAYSVHTLVPYFLGKYGKGEINIRQIETDLERRKLPGFTRVEIMKRLADEHMQRVEDGHVKPAGRTKGLEVLPMHRARLSPVDGRMFELIDSHKENPWKENGELLSFAKKNNVTIHMVNRFFSDESSASEHALELYKSGEAREKLRSATNRPILIQFELVDYKSPTSRKYVYYFLP
ncbi:MAG TPA: hypothetical protein VFF09_03890 [archaeon]|nr:hypothetical protein [archaeon]